jgi:N-acetylneuraminate synthase
MTYWIADICGNHNQDLTRTKKLIDEAKKCGIDAVKFQLFKADKLYYKSFKSQIKKMQSWELPEEFLPEIKKHCENVKIDFGCTPFDLDAVDILIDNGVDFLKIGSYENQYNPLIKKVIQTKKPWMISAGMLSLMQIDDLMKQEFMKINPPDVLFMCNSTYPAKPQECNLHQVRFCSKFVKGIISRNKVKPEIGWSDHSCEPGVIQKACIYGADHIEFHFDLKDKKGHESEIGHCWTPTYIKRVIHDVKIASKAEFGEKDYDSEARKWKMDEDGFRPLKEWREELQNG